MKKILSMEELTEVTGGYRMETWTNIIYCEYSVNNFESLTQIYGTLTKYIETDPDISPDQKIVLGNIMDTLLNQKKQSEAA